MWQGNGCRTAVEGVSWCSRDGRCRLEKLRIVVEKCWVFKKERMKEMGYWKKS